MDLAPPSIMWLLPIAAAAVPLVLASERGAPGGSGPAGETGGASGALATKHSSPMAKAVAAASQLAFTAQQDGNDMLALMHITEAVASLDTVRTLVPDHEIARSCGVDPHEMAADMDAARRQIVARLSDDVGDGEGQGVDERHEVDDFDFDKY